jgi:hypothetical protein
VWERRVRLGHRGHRVIPERQVQQDHREYPVLMAIPELLARRD